jgi:uncharacterized membrane protein YgcG
MISNTLLICIGVASAAIVVALMMWKPRRRLTASAEAEIAHAHNATFGSMLLSVAAAIGLARAQEEHARDGNPDSGHSWHGSHLDHGSHGGVSDGSGLGGGGDSGGGGL